MEDFVSVVFDAKSRVNYLQTMLANVIKLQHECDVNNTAALHANKTLSAPYSYKTVHDLLKTIIEGTPAMQMFTVYAMLFYTTHTEQHFTKTTHEVIMNKIMAATQLQPTGEYHEHSLLYDRTATICFGTVTPHQIDRDYRDMRREYQIRDNHPFHYLLNELMRIVCFVPNTNL